jgi:hypothetical protein
MLAIIQIEGFKSEINDRIRCRLEMQLRSRSTICGEGREEQ